jgi:hypothetical protein
LIEETRSLTANEISAPLANIPYEDQLDMKYEEAKKTVNSLIKQLRTANVPNARYIQIKNLLQPVRLLFTLFYSIIFFLDSAISSPYKLSK